MVDRKGVRPAITDLDDVDEDVHTDAYAARGRWAKDADEEVDEDVDEW